MHDRYSIYEQKMACLCAAISNNRGRHKNGKDDFSLFFLSCHHRYLALFVSIEAGVNTTVDSAHDGDV